MTIPVIMAQRTRLHPAMVAIGVVVVGQLFGFVGLFVAVPILSLLTIGVEEFWVKPIEEAEVERRREVIELPSGELGDRNDGADQHEYDDEDLEHDPEARDLHRRASTR